MLEFQVPRLIIFSVIVLTDTQTDSQADEYATKTREGFLRKNIVAVLRSRTFFLKVNKVPIFSEIT